MAGGARRAAPAVAAVLLTAALPTVFGPELAVFVGVAGLFLGLVAAGCLPLLEVPLVARTVDGWPTPRIDVNLLTLTSAGVFVHAVSGVLVVLLIDGVVPPGWLTSDQHSALAFAASPVGLWLLLGVGLPAAGRWDPRRVPGDGRLVLALVLGWYVLVLLGAVAASVALLRLRL